MFTVEEAVRESNKIEGILRDPTEEEIDKFNEFMKLDKLHIEDFISFVGVYQPDAELRIRPGMNVYIGNHTPPSGGDHVGQMLKDLIRRANDSRYVPVMAYSFHKEYESLHPFMDGNGRSGRMLWYWMMGKKAGLQLGFLHMWYYQSLAFAQD